MQNLKHLEKINGLTPFELALNGDIEDYKGLFTRALYGRNVNPNQELSEGEKGKLVSYIQRINNFVKENYTEETETALTGKLENKKDLPELTKYKWNLFNEHVERLVSEGYITI